MTSRKKKIKMWKGKHSVRTIDNIGFIPYNDIKDNPYPKKTGKTPSKEIELAKKYRDDYLSNNGKEM